MLKDFTEFIPTFVSLFWTVFFFLERKRNTRSQNVWMIALFFITISMGIGAFYWNCDGNYSLFYKLDILDAFATLTFIPVTMLYFMELTGDKWKHFTLKIILLFLPTAVIGGLSAAGYLLLGEEQATAFAREMMENNGGVQPASYPYQMLRLIANEYAYSLLLFLQAVMMITYAIRRLFQYRKHLEEFFSNAEIKEMKHHWAVLWGLLALMVLVCIIAITGYLLYVDYDIWISVYLVLIGVVLYFICYNVYCSQYTAEEFVQELKQSEEKDTVTSSQLREKILPRLIYAMTEEKAFLNKDLRIDDLAALVQTNRTYISRLIHDEYNCNFSEYVNGKRIEYAQELSFQNPHFTQEHISSLSGFSHPSSFSRIFKKQTGMTFREWQRQSQSQQFTTDSSIDC